MMPPEQIFDSGLFKVLDRLYAFVIGVRGTHFGKKAAGGFEVVVVALNAGFLQPVRHFLVRDDSQRGIGADAAALLQFFEPLAEFVQDRTFFKPAPCGHQAQRRHVVGFGFGGGPQRGFDSISPYRGESVWYRADCAQNRQFSGHPPALTFTMEHKWILLPLKCSRMRLAQESKSKNVGGALQMKQPPGIGGSNGFSGEHGLAQALDSGMVRHVNGSGGHG